MIASEYIEGLRCGARKLLEQGEVAKAIQFLRLGLQGTWWDNRVEEEEALKRVLELLRTGRVGEAVELLTRFEETEEDRWYRSQAKENWHTDGDIEVSEGAPISKLEAGAYVQAWVWVRAPDSRLERLALQKPAMFRRK